MDALRAQVEKLTRERDRAERGVKMNGEAAEHHRIRAERAEAKLADALGALASIESEMRGKSYMRETARAALAAAREQPTQELHAFDPCREGDEGDDPAHNFTCALLCIHCGLRREAHQPTQDKPEDRR
jgi:hypothetical protein